MADQIAAALEAERGSSPPAWLGSRDVTAQALDGIVEFEYRDGFGQATRGRIELASSGQSVEARYRVVLTSGASVVGTLIGVTVVAFLLGGEGFPWSTLALGVVFVLGSGYAMSRASWRLRVQSLLRSAVASSQAPAV